jgi:transcription initiation factor TFIIB
MAALIVPPSAVTTDANQQPLAGAAARYHVEVPTCGTLLLDDNSSIWSLLQDLKIQAALPSLEAIKSESVPPPLAPPPSCSSSDHRQNGLQRDPITEGTTCQYCASNDIVLDDGDCVCQQCGTLCKRFIDASAEWRYYSNDDPKGVNPTRCGMPLNELLPESSMGTMIGFTYNEKADMRIIRKYHLWNCMSYKERSLYNIFDMLTVNAVNHGIPKSILEEAKVMYKKISELKISRGENRSGLIASSIYMSCKSHKVPRSTKEIAKIFNLKPTTMTKGCKRFQELMKMSMESTQAEDFICRFCSRLSLDPSMRDVCKHVIRKADDLCIVCENTPPSIAAGAIFLCSSLCGWKVGKKELAEACEISQVTISKCYKKMHVYRLDLLSPDVIQRHGIT